MRVPRSIQCLLGNFLVISLLPHILAAAFRLDTLTRNLPYRLFQRSLPGSLATAPEGAVGYQPPPGPVATDDWTTKPSSVADTAATVTSTTAPQDQPHEPRQELAEVEGKPTLTARPPDNAVIVTGTVIKTARQTGTAGRDVFLPPASLLFSVSLALLQL